MFVSALTEWDSLQVKLMHQPALTWMTALLMTTPTKHYIRRLRSLENVVSFSIAELCCYGDMPHTEKKKREKLGNIVLEAHCSTVNFNMLNPVTVHSTFFYAIDWSTASPSQRAGVHHKFAPVNIIKITQRTAVLLCALAQYYSSFLHALLSASKVKPSMD